MIKNWTYNQIGEKRNEVKKYISDGKFKTVDVGASAMYWSYPECKFVVDSIEIYKEDTTLFNINLENKSSWGVILNYVQNNGKFDFSICSHTLEDVFNPMELIGFLQDISKSGFVAVPSKYDEFSFLYQNKYRGNAHHKHFFDFVDDELTIFPKFSWIETDQRSDDIIKYHRGGELSFYWEQNIPVRIFGDGIPYKSDGELINNFYKEITN